MAETPGRLRLLRGTAAQWSAANPTLASGEIGYDTTNNIVKIGNGSDPWSTLPGIGGGGGATDHGNLTGLADDDHPQYALLADAVALSTSAALAEVQNGYAGTAATAARGDHKHPISHIVPTISIISTYWTTPQRTSGTGSFNINRMYVTPYNLSIQDNRALTISALGVHVTGAGSADSTCEVAVYASQAHGYPDFTQKLVTATITTGNTTGEKSATLGSNYTFPKIPDLYWAAMVVHGTTSPTFTTIDIPSQWPRALSIDGGGMVTQPQCYSQNSITSLPTTQIGLSVGNESPLILFVRPV